MIDGHHATGGLASALVGLMALCLVSCSSEQEPGDDASSTTSTNAVSEASTRARWFIDEAERRGLSFNYESDATDECRMPEIMGGGVALLDIDGDGDLDVICVQGGRIDPATRLSAPTHAIFANDGTGHFTDVTSSSGIAGLDYGMGIAAGDVDNDGDVDVYLTNLGPNRLLLNDGTGRFTTSASQDVLGDAGWGTSAAFFDYDNDGWLDLYVCNYLDWSPETALECFNTMGGVDYCSPRNYLAPAVDRLYRNLGDGIFEDVTDRAGISTVPGTGLGVVATDVDDDGLIDLFVANDGMADALWMNQGDGTFREEAMMRGCALDRDGRAAAGMGVAAGDVDLDGDDDIIVCNLRNESDSLFLVEDGGRFTNATARVGLAATSRRYTRFGQGLFDFNGDGWLDLYQANGRVMRQQDEPNPDDPYAEPNLVFAGGTDRFTLVEGAEAEGLASIRTSRGAAFGDVNGDGAVDVLIVNRDAPARLLINHIAGADSMTVLDVRTTDGRAAIGARVRVRDAEGALRFSGTVRRASSYLASSDPRLFIGGLTTGESLHIEVQWVGTDSFESRTVTAPSSPLVIQPNS